MGRIRFNSLIAIFLIQCVCSCMCSSLCPAARAQSQNGGQAGEQAGEQTNSKKPEIQKDERKDSVSEGGSYANWFSRPVATETPFTIPAEPGPGPLRKLRGELYGQIKAAKKRGVGIDPYLKWCNELETMAAEGQPEEKVRERLFFILNHLHSQMNRGARIAAS